MGNNPTHSSYIINDDGIQFRSGDKYISIDDQTISMGNDNDAVIKQTETGFYIKNGSQKLTLDQNGFCMKDTNGKMTLNEEGICVKTNNEKIILHKDGIDTRVNGNTIQIGKQGIYLNKLPKQVRTPNKSLVCFDRSCIEFECADRVQIQNNNIYCGDKVYYEFINNEFINKNE
jgi:hypothetical protein